MGTVISVFFKQHLEYKSPYMSKNVHPNTVMVVLQDLIETPLYKDLNVTIHHQWASLCALHMNSNFQNFIYNNISFDNFDFDNEKIILYTNKFNDT
jgi:hypothetical protein